MPAARLDGNASSAEAWPWVTSSSRPERNYLAEVHAATGDYEDLFIAACNTLATQYAEVLVAVNAPRWQREAPRTLAEALARPDADAWIAAMLEELASLRSKHVFEFADLPAGHMPIDLRWVFSYKLRPDGAVEKHKARLVAKGYTQQYGIDFYEVWAPTGRLAAYRLLLAHAAEHKLPVFLLDFKTAFLNGRLHEEIYVTQPPGFSDSDDTRVWRLHRALYGLKQAAHAWHAALRSALGDLGYQPSQVDPAVFVRTSTAGSLMMHTHVDDCAATGPPSEVQADFDKLLLRFEGRALGELDGQLFLGMFHERDWDKGLIHVSNPHQIEKLLSEHASYCSTPISSPCDPKTVLTAAQDSDTADHPLLASYAAIVGSLMYIASSTRPDLCFVASLLARFMSAPRDQHAAAAVRALRYLNKTRHHRLIIGFAPRSSPLEVWSDSDHGCCPDTRRSVAGLVVSAFGSTVHWRSVRQSTVAKSTMIAEYYAASAAADEAIYFRQLLSELSYNLEATSLMCDNASACSILNQPIVNDKSRYAAINAHYVRERVALREIDIVSVPTDRMLADCMTKALTPDKHDRACKLLAVAKGE